MQVNQAEGYDKVSTALAENMFFLPFCVVRDSFHY